MRSRFSVALLLTLSAAAAACSADTDSEESLGQDEAEKRIKPKDSENLGRLQVNWPQGWQAAINAADDATVTYRNGGVVIGVQSRLKEGDGCLALGTRFGTTLQDCTVALTKNKTTTFDLSALKVTYDATATGKLAVDFGPKPTLSIRRKNPASPGSEPVIWNQGNSGYFNGSNTRGVITLPGDYVFSWGLPILDEKNESLAKGKFETVNLDPAEKRATIKVKAPTRELPNAAFGCGSAHRNFLIQRNADNSAGAYGEPDGSVQQQGAGGATSEGIVAWQALPLTKDTDFRVFPFAASEGAMHYEYVVNSVVVPLDVKPGKTVTVPVERLDVDDVEVEKEDGSTYNVKGQYVVYKQGPNNSWLPITQYQQSYYGGCSGTRAAWSAPTGTGLDLPPGTYRLVITYNTAEGAKTKDEVVTLP